MIKFKEGQEEVLNKELFQVKPKLRNIITDMAYWVTDQGYEFVITDLMSEDSEDKKLKRVSKSHSDGRAVDIRVRNWPLTFRAKFEVHFEKKYKDVAGISKVTNKPNLIVVHDNGNGIHCHIQIKP